MYFILYYNKYNTKRYVIDNNKNLMLFNWYSDANDYAKHNNLLNAHIIYIYDIINK